jgi:CBS domain-containing protein
MNDLNKVPVSEAMSAVKHTVSPIEKLDVVANLFQQHALNSIPVVDELGKCVGIITSSDLVQFQSELAGNDAQISHGVSFEPTRRDSDGSLEFTPHPFDEVQRQMTTVLQTVEPDISLMAASQIMCEQHIHHLIVLDDSQRPVGILSSLDILAKLKG